MNLWERVIKRRLRQETYITENQFGFMSGRSTNEDWWSNIGEIKKTYTWLSSIWKRRRIGCQERYLEGFGEERNTYFLYSINQEYV